MVQVKKAGAPPGNALTAEVTLNESEQTASFYLPKTALTKRADATFQQTVILLTTVSPSVRGATNTESWSIDRTDGSLVRTLTFSYQGSELSNFRWEGSCKKKAPVDRAF